MNYITLNEWSSTRALGGILSLGAKKILGAATYIKFKFFLKTKLVPTTN